MSSENTWTPPAPCCYIICIFLLESEVKYGEPLSLEPRVAELYIYTRHGFGTSRIQLYVWNFQFACFPHNISVFLLFRRQKIHPSRLCFPFSSTVVDWRVLFYFMSKFLLSRPQAELEAANRIRKFRKKGFCVLEAFNGYWTIGTNV